MRSIYVDYHLTLTFGMANIWVKFNALREGVGVKVQLFSP